ncbi:hypothetical protein [Pasteuria penetrans]|uniref:hypothetical protein n=1 Tax=Pasteuria penetrans TaxID=86005 RepID=UPI000FA71979|nr:hypothetical protein [Pasteuria penetrans]
MRFRFLIVPFVAFLGTPTLLASSASEAAIPPETVVPIGRQESPNKGGEEGTHPRGKRNLCYQCVPAVGECDIMDINQLDRHTERVCQKIRGVCELAGCFDI